MNSNQSIYLLAVSDNDNFNMFDLDNVTPMEEINWNESLDFLLKQSQDTTLIQYQDTTLAPTLTALTPTPTLTTLTTQANETMFEENLNQIQQPISVQYNQGHPITIEMSQTLQELGVSEVLVENVPVR